MILTGCIQANQGDIMMARHYITRLDGMVRPMFNDPKGPIESFSFGRFVILGEEHSGSGDERIGKGKDIRMIGRRVERWKEREGHVLDRSMVEGVLDRDVRVVVIGSGESGMLAVPDEIVKFLLKNGIEKVIVLRTPDACREYNRLYREGEKAALLAHGTC